MLKDTRSSYGLVTIVLHWLMSLMLIGLFGLGLYMVELTYYDSWYKGSFNLHKSLGMAIAFLLIFRFVWRAFGEKPAPVDSSSKMINTIAHRAHLSIYILLIGVVISGYLISSADGRPIEVFALFSIPGIDLLVGNQADIAGEIHYYGVFGLSGIVILHALGALKHHFIDKDVTLIRMLKPLKDE